MDFFNVGRFDCRPNIRIDDEESAKSCATSLSEENQKPYEVKPWTSFYGLLGTSYFQVNETSLPKQQNPKPSIFGKILKWIRL